MRIELDVTERQAIRLGDLVTHYNQNTGANLTLEQWLDLHLRELAVSQTVANSLQNLEADVSAYREQRVNEAKTNALDSL